MMLKLFVGVVAALGLGFTAMHFSDSPCNGGGCPLSRMLSGGTSDAKCDNPGGDCCTKEQTSPISTEAPKGGCCMKGGSCDTSKVNAKAGCCDDGAKVSTKAGCCKAGAACCNPPQDCCAETKVKACPLCGGAK